MNQAGFVDEAEAYGLLERAGLCPPRHGNADGPLPFEPGEPVVVKGLGENVWHKSELGAVHFLPFEKQSVLNECRSMRQHLESGGHRWIEGLVCEQIDVACNNAGVLVFDKPVEDISMKEWDWIIGVNL